MDQGRPPEKVIPKAWRHQGGQVTGYMVIRRKGILGREKGNAKALRQEHAEEAAGRPVWLEHRERDGERSRGRDQRTVQRLDPMGTCRPW